MINSLQITATIYQPELLKDKVEKLAYRRYGPGYGVQKMPDDHEVIETSSTEVHVNGTLAMNNSGEQIKRPFITCFVFTCIKKKGSVYKLEWSSSLS
jgi:hypothetical protein